MAADANDRSSQLLELVGDFYDSPDRPALLKVLHDGLGKMMPLSPMLFFLPTDSCNGKWDPGGVISCPDGAAWAREWSLFYLRIDPLAQAAFREPEPRAIRYIDVSDLDDFRSSRFSRDFLANISVSHALLLPLVCHGERLGAVWLLRDSGRGEFTEEERKLGDLVAYHMSRAMLLVNLSLCPSLCNQPGVLVYDQDRNLLFQNDKAQTILGKSDISWCLDRSADRTPVVQTERGVFHCRVLPVRPTVDTSRVLRSSPLPLQGNVVILEPYRSSLSLARHLSHLDLSLRQSEVVMEVLKGRSNKEIAESLGISLQTVKDHLHEIFRILRVRSRTELMAVVVGSGDDSDK